MPKTIGNLSTISKEQKPFLDSMAKFNEEYKKQHFPFFTERERLIINLYLIFGILAGAYILEKYLN